MGDRGPAPKREAQRRRSNKPVKPVTKASSAPAVEAPAANADWHPVAKAWFESLAVSGQSAFYQPSDWATAAVLAESMSREFKPQPVTIGSGERAATEMVALPPKGASLAAWLKGMTALMATEGDRRRASLELSRPSPAGEGSGDVTELDVYRRRLRQPS